MTQTEALHLALDWLKCYQDKSMSRNNAEELADEIITAIKAALEAKDEPVVNTDHVICPNCVHQFRAIPQNVQKLMLASGFEPPFTTPPQRKPLTDEQIQQIFIANSVVVDNGNAYMVAGLRTVNIARAIEAVLEAKDEPVVWNKGVPAMLPKQKEGETFIVSYEPKPEAKDEPVSNGDTLFRQFMSEAEKAGVTHLTPPQRTWIGLTDEHKEGLIFMTDPNPEPYHLRELIDVVEFQLKEKNT